MQKQVLGWQTPGYVACCVLILNQHIPSCPCEDLTRAHHMFFWCTETSLLQEPQHRFHIKHHVSPSGEGCIPGSTAPTPPRPRQSFPLLPISLFSGAHSVASLLHLHYLYGVTPALPISAPWLYRAAAWAGEACWKTFACCNGERMRGWNVRSDANSQGLYKMISQKGEKNLVCLFFFFFFFKVHNVPTCHHLFVQSGLTYSS